MAILYGVDNAVMIWNLMYWIEHNEANGMNFYDGRTWTFNSIEAFTKIFPFWSKGQIRRIMKSLEDQGVIMTGNYNASQYDRKTWYAFTDSFLQMHLSKSTNGSVEIDNSNIDSYINKDTTEQIVNSDREDETERDARATDSPHVEKVSKVGKKGGKESTREKVCLFEDSRFHDFELFKTQFQEPEYAGVDLYYYFKRAETWSGGNSKRKADWIMTVKNWMTMDYQRGELQKIKPQGLPESAMRYLQSMADIG